MDFTAKTYGRGTRMYAPMRQVLFSEMKTSRETLTLKNQVTDKPSE